MKTIAYQGIKGSFSYMTASREFGEANHFLGLETFSEVFDALEGCVAECAVVPIENSLVGSIYENYDLMYRRDVFIISENFIKIDHCLLAVPLPGMPMEERLKKITKVFSHPKALEQCSGFFRGHPWIKPVLYRDTGRSAADIAELRDPECAAIASVLAGQIYGLEILEMGIEDDPKNYTRFVTVAKKGVANEQADKCSLMLKLKHTPGSLVNVLQRFACQGMNLSKIESRPIRGKPFEYLFYIDFEFSVKRRKEIESLLQELSCEVGKLIILGFYKAGQLWIP